MFIDVPISSPMKHLVFHWYFHVSHEQNTFVDWLLWGGYIYKYYYLAYMGLLLIQGGTGAPTFICCFINPMNYSYSSVN